MGRVEAARSRPVADRPRPSTQEDLMAQEHKQTKKSSETEDKDEAAAQSDVAERKEQLDEDIDAILGEIDDVLETNAEDFVKSFIQKGGE
jgi:ubiquitin-like protein Pup